MTNLTVVIPLTIREIEQENYHLFLHIRIGRRKANLLLDTGASKSVFDQQKILKFISGDAIKKGDTHSVGLGTDSVETYIGAIPNVKFETYRLPCLEVAILDISHVNRTYATLHIEEIDGVLGSDFLVKYKAVINFKKAFLSLEFKGGETKV